MLPGLRGVLVAMLATFVIAGFGLNGLATLQLAHDKAASLPKAAARFAGLAFAERADWTPEQTPPAKSLEQLPPFARLSAATSGPAMIVEPKAAPAAAPPPEPAAAEAAAPVVVPVSLASAEAQVAGTPEVELAVASRVEPKIEPTIERLAEGPKAEMRPIDLAAIREAIRTAVPPAVTEPAGAPEPAVPAPPPVIMAEAPAATPSDAAALEPPTAAQAEPYDGDTTATIVAAAESAPSAEATPAAQPDVTPAQTLPTAPPLPQTRPANPARAKTVAHPRKRVAEARPHPKKKKKRKHVAKRPAKKPVARLSPPTNPLAALLDGSRASDTATR